MKFSNCDKHFDQKCHLINHLRRKKPCIDKNNNILDHKNKYNNSSINITTSTDKLLSTEFKNDNLDILPQKINPLKCLLCNKEYKHQSGLCKHKKQKHKNYDNDILNMQN